MLISYILSYSVACLFVFLIVAFEDQTFKILMKFELIFFFFSFCGVFYLRSLCLAPSHKDFSPMVSRSFIVLAFIFSSELAFVYSVK